MYLAPPRGFLFTAPLPPILKIDFTGYFLYIMPIAEFLRILLARGSKFWEGAVTEKGGGGSKEGGSNFSRGGAVTFQNMRSVQTHLRENFTFNLL